MGQFVAVGRLALSVLVLVVAISCGRDGGDAWAKHRVMPSELAAAFHNAVSFEILSLYYTPASVAQLPPGMHATGTFHGYPVLGRTKLSQDEAKNLMRALEKGIAESSKFVLACFEPRHGVRAIDAGGTAADLVICFQCLQIQYSMNAKDGGLITSGSPEPAFDALFAKAGIPKAPPDPQQ